MTTPRRLTRTAGIFSLLTVALSISAFFVDEPVLTNTGYIVDR